MIVKNFKRKKAFWRIIQISGLITFIYNIAFLVAQIIILVATLQEPNLITILLATMQGIAGGISWQHANKTIKWQKSK